jgi:DNA-binding response OmpR family regulator
MIHSVLVVEDDAVIRKGIMALLKIDGRSAVAAANVAEAVAHLDATTPTHVLLDLNLPDGAGTNILRRIREQALPVRVALVTGAIDTALFEEAHALGVEAVFVKPPNWDKLLAWIAQP